MGAFSDLISFVISCDVIEQGCSWPYEMVLKYSFGRIFRSCMGKISIVSFWKVCVNSPNLCKGYFVTFVSYNSVDKSATDCHGMLLQ